ncbi:MAG TPA: FAD-binding and (Fe-S)-binding domain-containing protein [Myxococcales bacterium]
MTAGVAAGAAPAPDKLGALLEAIVGRDRVLDTPAQRIAHAHDASFYRLIPQAVAFAASEQEVAALLALSHELALPLTFRAAGTSLSGQAITDGILVDLSRAFGEIGVEERGLSVRVQPGVIGGHVNLALQPYGRKMGPDPASIHTCRMGGILSNNASGMCCGVEQNAYHTLQSLTFILPSGTRIDTAEPGADDELRAREPALHAGLLDLKRRLEGDVTLAARIRAKYRMKNTTGYSLNAFLDFARPVDIFAHVLIGAEGTLAFISQAVLATVPDLPVKLTGLLLFPDVHAACAAIAPLRDAGAKALELMDRASLRSVQEKPGMPASFKGLGPQAAALLTEFQEESGADPSELERRAAVASARLSLLEPARFTRDPAEQGRLWLVRQGLFPSVGAVRKSGTTVIIEDVAFPLDRLADAADDLTALFHEHGYPEAIVFGHAKDGNLHFVITQSFNDPASVGRYERFIDDLVPLVVQRHGGALKAEHGTGRNMAPFVEAEWGGEALAVMRRLKQLADPRGLLNPGVILPAGPRAHLTDLKPMPTVEEEVDACIECGFCEPRCPSRELTLTPRQRIVMRREMARLGAGGKPAGASREELEEDWQYLALDTCAVDGLCATACPVGIDTGQLTKRLRQKLHNGAAHAVACSTAIGFSGVETLARAALRVGHALHLPLWREGIPAPARRARTDAASAQAIYFPSCISRIIGALPGEPNGASLQEAVVRVSGRVGLPVHVPRDAAGVCCGVPFSSKGYADAHAVAANQAIERMWKWSEQGRLPIVIDTSPCVYGILHSREALGLDNQERFDKLQIVDSVAFAHDRLLPRLRIQRKAASVALHPVCSLVKMGLVGKLQALARACSDRVCLPRDAGCCGFAGDRGFLVPELTASATAREAAEVRRAEHDGYYSSSRTCEIGMARATGKPYRSIWFLLDEATR